MEAGLIAVLSGVVVLATGLVKAIELLIGYIIKRSSKESPKQQGTTLTPSEREAVFSTKNKVEHLQEQICCLKTIDDRVDKVHAVTTALDEDGAYRVYSPKRLHRELQAQQASIVETQQRIAQTQELIVKILERMEAHSYGRTD